MLAEWGSVKKTDTINRVGHGQGLGYILDSIGYMVRFVGYVGGVLCVKKFDILPAVALAHVRHKIRHLIRGADFAHGEGRGGPPTHVKIRTKF